MEVLLLCVQWLDLAASGLLQGDARLLGRQYDETPQSATRLQDQLDARVAAIHSPTIAGGCRCTANPWRCLATRRGLSRYGGVGIHPGRRMPSTRSRRRLLSAWTRRSFEVRGRTSVPG